MTLLTRILHGPELRGGCRPLDTALILVSLPVFAPVAAGFAAAIWVEDRGSPWFWQERVGRGRRPIRVLKLRTMKDGRITRVGRWLRPTGVDEIPQFWNVLRGDMDLVGPRPLTPADAARLGACDDEFDRRFMIKPGITGLVQVLGGRGPRHCAKLERLYARRRTTKSDLALLLASVMINVAGRHRVRRWLGRTAPRRDRCGSSTVFRPFSRDLRPPTKSGEHRASIETSDGA